MEIKSYRDIDGNVVKLGDEIFKVDYVTGENEELMGKVIAIEKKGFYVRPQTEKTTYKYQLWGKFTRKKI